jgi:repressor LexA
MRQSTTTALTDRQAEILRYIVSRVRTDGIPPTHQEIADEFGLRSAFGVRQHLRLISRKGYIDLLSGKSRGLRLTAPAEEARARLVDIPIVGRIAAGCPVLAQQNLEGCVSVSDGIFPPGVLFAVRVQGDSMTGVGICPGDLAIIRQQPTVDNGQIAACLLGEEATLKRFCRQGAKVTLKAENPEMAAIVVGEEPGMELRVLGLYVGLLRRQR